MTRSNKNLAESGFWGSDPDEMIERAAADQVVSGACNNRFGRVTNLTESIDLFL